MPRKYAVISRATGVLCEMLERRQLLSVSPLTASSSVEEQLTAYTTRNLPVTTAPTVYGAYPWPSSGANVVRELVLANGDRIEAGYAGTDFALAKYNANGTLDRSFGGGDGQASIDFGTPSDMLLNADLRPDGKILLFGLTNASGTYQVVLARQPRWHARFHLRR